MSMNTAKPLHSVSSGKRLLSIPAPRRNLLTRSFSHTLKVCQLDRPIFLPSARQYGGQLVSSRIRRATTIVAHAGFPRPLVCLLLLLLEVLNLCVRQEHFRRQGGSALAAKLLFPAIDDRLACGAFEFHRCNATPCARSVDCRALRCYYYPRRVQTSLYGRPDSLGTANRKIVPPPFAPPSVVVP